MKPRSPAPIPRPTGARNFYFLFGTAWVCAIAVIAGSPVACLPFEDLKVIQAHRAALRRKSSRPEAPLPPRPRSCQGAPITGRPSYKATETASYPPSPSSISPPPQIFTTQFATGLGLMTDELHKTNW